MHACAAYVAMTSERPYRPSFSAETARRVVEMNASTQFDAAVTSALLDVLGADDAEQDVVPSEEDRTAAAALSHQIAERDRRSRPACGRWLDAVYAFAAVVGIAAGVVIALPFLDGGAGSWAWAALLVLGFLVGALLLTRWIVVSLPRVYQRFRSHELGIVPGDTPNQGDLLVLAANWGLTSGDSAGYERSVVRAIGMRTSPVYVPVRKQPVCPGASESMSFCAVRNGAAAVPELVSVPLVVATRVQSDGVPAGGPP